MLYCDLEETGKVFNNKKIYKCKNCGLEAGLEDPEAQILCFVENKNAEMLVLKETQKAIEKAAQDFQSEINQKFDQSSKVVDVPFEPQSEIQDPATEELINARMDICNKCEYYKEDSCMLCGCRVVRGTIYQNKLADKNANCPDGRWSAIS